jgi:hypothetical protein
MSFKTLARLAAPAVTLLAAAGLLRKTIGYGLMGHDSYPLILTSSVASPGDVLSQLSQRLMDGRYPDAFYRPLLGLTIGVDRALWGLEPWGYQVTSALAFAACALSLVALARRLAGPSAWGAPLVAALVFTLHPRHFEILPAPSRRAEVLCCTFMLLALWAQLAPRRLELGRPGIAPALLTLLAIASKETAFGLPLLVGAGVLACSPHASLLGRIRQALAFSVPHLLAAAGLLAVRWSVIGGLGGHGETSLGQAAASLPQSLLAVVAGVVLPVSPLREVEGRALAAAVLVAGAAALLLRAWSRAEPIAEDPAGASAVRTMGVALVWLGLIVLIQAAAGLVAAWHLLIPAAGWALLCGAALTYLAAQARHGAGRLARGSAAVATLLLVVLLAWPARFSPLFYPYDEWERGTAASREFLTEAQRKIDEAPDGKVVRVSALPYWVVARPDRVSLEAAAVLAGYSVQAWAELRFPQRKITVSIGKSGSGRPGPDELWVRIAGYRDDL